MPEMPGSIKSRSTRSTSSRSRTVSASSPVRAAIGRCDSRRISVVRTSCSTSSSSTTRTFTLGLPDSTEGLPESPEASGGVAVQQRQLDDEAAAVAGLALDAQVAAVAAHDLVADPEAGAGAAAGELGRVEGPEDALLLGARDAGAAVGDAGDGAVALGRDRPLEAAAALAHGGHPLAHQD